MKTIIYIKVIIYGSQAPFRVNITECFKAFMNQAWHRHGAEKYYLYVADKRSKVKKADQHHAALEEEALGARARLLAVRHRIIFMCAIFVHTPSCIDSDCKIIDF